MGSRAASAVLVGRHDELARLESLLDDVAGGQSVVALVAGEAGVGKSRVVEELTARATTRGFRVLTGWCVEFGEEIWPLAPLRDIMAALVDQLDSGALELVVGTARRELGRLVPELGSEEPSLGPLASARLCELVVGVVKRMARRGPLVLVVEDLHWADTSTRALLALLTGTRDLGSVLVVGTYRSDELHRRHPLRPVLAAIERAARPQRIELAPLDAAATADLIETLSGLTETDAVEAIHRRSGGNPFFVEELVAARTAGVAGPTETLRQVVLARAATLDDTAVGLLRVGAAAGSTTAEVLAAAGGFSAKHSPASTGPRCSPMAPLPLNTPATSTGPSNSASKQSRNWPVWTRPGKASSGSSYATSTGSSGAWTNGLTRWNSRLLSSPRHPRHRHEPKHSPAQQ